MERQKKSYPKCVSFEDDVILNKKENSHKKLNDFPRKVETSPTNTKLSMKENITFESDIDSGSDTSSIDEHGHVNSLFQLDEDVQFKRPGLLLQFGGRGKGAGEFQDATSITHVGDGKVLVTDMVNSRILSFNKLGNPGVTFIAEDIMEPWATEVTSDGFMYVTSRKNKCVVILSREGEVLDTFRHELFQRPSGLAITKTGHIIVTDIITGTVSIHESTGRWVKNLDESACDKGKMLCPRYVTVSPLGEIIVSDSGNHCVKVFDENGKFIRKIGQYGKGDGNLKYPYGVTTDSFGNIIVADHYNDRLSLFTREGEFICYLLTMSDGIVHPQGVALSPDMKLYVTHGNLKAYQVSVFKHCISQTSVTINAFAEL